MKNLLVYISPHKRYNPEHEAMIRVQIENSLDYWRPEDIVLFNNFPYEYKGIKAIVEPNLWDKISTTNPKAKNCVKVNAIIYLLENKILTEETWNHDLDAFQLAPLDVKLTKDMGVVCYGDYPTSRLQEIDGRKDFKNQINFGNVFFKPESLDIFRYLLEMINTKHIYDEDGMTLMIDKGIYQDRIEVLNRTYNLGIRWLRTNINKAEKPLKIAHFPPNQERWLSKFQSILPNKLKKRLNEELNDLDTS